MPYMAVGSRQILFNDTQAPSMAPPVSQQNNNTQVNPVNPTAQINQSNPIPVAQEHIGQHLDIRV